MSQLQYRNEPQNTPSNDVNDQHVKCSIDSVIKGVLFNVDYKDLNESLRESVANSQYELSYHDAYETAFHQIKYHLDDELLNVMECQWYHLAMSEDYKQSLSQAFVENDIPKLKTLLLTLSNKMLIHSENFISTRLQDAFSDLMGYIYNVNELEEYFVYYASPDLVADMKKLEMGYARTIDTDSECDIIILSTTVLTENAELLEVAKNRRVMM